MTRSFAEDARGGCRGRTPRVRLRIRGLVTVAGFGSAPEQGSVQYHREKEAIQTFLEPL